MGRFTTFLSGFLLGGVVTYLAMHYHIVHAEAGVEFVPKVIPNLHDVYVDIREFEISDWEQHRNLAAALIKAEKSELIGESAERQLRDSLDQAWRDLTNPSP
jgi:hypothetical protein